MRTFIAIDIQPTNEIRNLLSDFLKTLEGLEIKYTELNNYHITLAFLGETTDTQVSNICKDLDLIQSATKKIEISLEGVGAFKNSGSPSVIWIGIRPNEPLKELFQIINLTIESNGFAAEHRKFLPHLTLGRVKRAHPNHNFDLLMSKYKKLFLGKVSVTEFVCYQSLLTPEGPIYKPVQRFKI
jgi:2'-5' RNA ligase